jgi:hypothetical protein
MERTAEIIASTAIAQYGVSEAIAPKLTRIIRHLLDVESNAANGTIYSTSTSSSATDGNEGEIGGALSQEGKSLRIRIPYFGTIRLEREHGGILKGPQVEVQGQGTAADSYGMVSAHAEIQSAAVREWTMIYEQATRKFLHETDPGDLNLNYTQCTLVRKTVGISRALT